MDFDIIVAVSSMFGAAGVAFLARRHARKPSEPLKVRLIDYNYVVILAILAILVAAARLLALILGHR